ncbi:LysE family translocator [Pseudomonas sp. PDM10]|jgi:threonine/homoserine/homoserine lactone efflux protein|uniref:LysE family translocator n=1 Tax=Pseudomonas sp. PDM10 TaxID=2769269 RepID=UPI00177B5458|nr:LysE family translocator [Pseudomonas sp. PDM10]MBD9600099.1 LysE family translocator [Pseudomonas sp. PDM10]
MLSTFPTLLPFMLFAFVASITPGPTNILVLSNSARYGFKATLPIIFGACASAAVIVLLVGYGLGESLKQIPLLQYAMQWLGVTWLSYLAWQIYHSATDTFDSDVSGNQRRPRLLTAAGLQWINPKTWMMAMAVVSVFADNGADRFDHIVYLSFAFFVIALPCMTAWAVLGSSVNQWLRSTKALGNFNRSMGLLLAGSTWLSVWVG